MTIKQIIQTTEETLSAIAGKVLQPETNEHKWDGAPGIVKCQKCDTIWVDDNSDCPKTDPIPLTPANAFKWRDWAMEEFGETAFDTAKCFAMDLWSIQNGIPTSSKHKLEGWRIADSFFANAGEPIHYIKAACLCVLQAKGND